MSSHAWHGWRFHRGTWLHVCSAPTLSDVSSLLLRLLPGVPCRYHALTLGRQLPRWTPRANP